MISRETIHSFTENRCPTYFIAHFPIPNRSIGVGFILIALGWSWSVHIIFLLGIPSYKNSLASDKCSEFNWIAASGQFICHRHWKTFLDLVLSKIWCWSGGTMSSVLAFAFKSLPLVILKFEQLSYLARFRSTIFLLGVDQSRSYAIISPANKLSPYNQVL